MQGVRPGAGFGHPRFQDPGFHDAREVSERWAQVQRTLRASVTTANWQKWLSRLQPDISPEQVTLIAPSEFIQTFVENHHRKQIEAIVGEVFGANVTVSLVSLVPSLEVDLEDGDPLAERSTAEGSPDKRPIPASRREVEIEAINDLTPSPLFGRYTFENFITGPSNNFAHAAAQSVADQPGCYNPLLIFGGAGLGKTHLLQAIGHHVRQFWPELLVRYVTSEKFLNDFIDCIRRKRTDDFKYRYRTTDVLLLDDVQFLEGKEQVLEEFFHTFNALHQLGKQLVITSDRHPRNFTVEDRLRSRFEWGLVTDIQPPKLETRLAILRKGAELSSKSVPREVLEYIANSVSDNIRELEGALTRVTAFASLTHCEIDLALAEQVLGQIQDRNHLQPLTAHDIMVVVADSYGFTVADVTGASRRQPLVLCRQVAMYLCRNLTNLSLPKIGEAFGGRDHTTVIHSIEKVKSVMTLDKPTFERVDHLLQRLGRSRG